MLQTVLYNVLQTALYNVFQTVLYNVLQTVLNNVLQTVLYNVLQTVLYNVLQTVSYNVLQTVLYKTFQTVLYNVLQSPDLKSTSSAKAIPHFIAYYRHCRPSPSSAACGSRSSSKFSYSTAGETPRPKTEPKFFSARIRR